MIQVFALDNWIILIKVPDKIEQKSITTV